jgi:hypothetical protein
VASGGRPDDHRPRAVDEMRNGTGNRADATRNERGCGGYRAETIKLRPVVNDKNETIGRINDFIFGKDGNIYAVLAVGDFTGLGGQLAAIPFRSLNLEGPSGHIVLPRASRNALQKLPVIVSSR